VIIDAHTHFFPPELAENPRDWGGSRGEFHWIDLVCPGKGKSIQGWASAEQMLRDMDSAGVDMAFLLGWYWQSMETCLWHNRRVGKLLEAYPDRFVGFAACNAGAEPRKVESCLIEAESFGFTGIGELLPPAQGHDLQSPGIQVILEFAVKRDWPINFHITEPVGHSYAGRMETPLHPMVELAQNNRANTFIFAHLGGLLPFYEFNPFVREALANVYYDTSACPLLYTREVLPAASRAAGAHRILWGTDYPLRIFPITQKDPDFKTYLNLIRDENELSPADRAEILGGNAYRLIPQSRGPSNAG